MLRVDGNAVIVLLAAGSDVRPATLLLLEIEARGVWKEEDGQEHTRQTKPRHNVEFGLCVDVVEQDGRSKGAKLATGR